MDFPDFFSMVSKDGPLAKTLPSFEHSFLVLDGRVLEKKSTSVSESHSPSHSPKDTKNGFGETVTFFYPWALEDKEISNRAQG